MSVFRFGGTIRSPPRRPTVQGSQQSPFCTSPSQLQDVTLDSTVNSTLPFNFGLRSPGKTSPLRGRTMKEYEEQLGQLKKENFNLKLKIYFLEERMDRITGFDDKEEIVKKNIELNVEREALHKELKDKENLLLDAAKAMDLMEAEHKEQLERVQNNYELEKGVLEEKIQELEKELNIFRDVSRNQNFLKLNETPVTPLFSSEGVANSTRNVDLQVSKLEAEVEHLEKLLEKEKDHVKFVEDNMCKAQEEAENVRKQHQNLEVDLKRHVSEVEKLTQELEQKNQDFLASNSRIHELEDALSKKEPEIQIKIQELNVCERLIEEQQNQIEHQNKVLIEIQITLDEKEKQIDALRSSLAARDTTISTLEERLAKAKKYNNILEMKLEALQLEVHDNQNDGGDAKSPRKQAQSPRPIGQSDAEFTFKQTDTLATSRSSDEEVVTRKRTPSEIRIIMEEKLKKLEIQRTEHISKLQDAHNVISEKEKSERLLQAEIKAKSDKLQEFEAKLKKFEEKNTVLDNRNSSAYQTIQTFTKMCKDLSRDVEQLKSDVKKKEKTIQDLTLELKELKDVYNKTKWENHQLQAQVQVPGGGGVTAAFDEVKDMTEEENERLWAEVEDKNKKLVQLTAERDVLSNEKEMQVQSLTNCLKEKSLELEDKEKMVGILEEQLKSKENQTKDLENSLNDLQKQFNELKIQNADPTDKLLRQEIEAQKREIERLNGELRKRTFNLQELVNKELWDKNREIEKLQDRLAIISEQKDLQISALNHQLRVLQDRYTENGLKFSLPSGLVITEMQQPITFNQHVHFPQVASSRENSLISFDIPKEEISKSLASAPMSEAALKDQLTSAFEQNKYLSHLVEELKEKIRNTPERDSESKLINSLKTECIQAKKNVEIAEKGRKELTEICLLLTQRLEELAHFLRSLLENKELLGGMVLKRKQIIKKVLEESMEFSRRLSQSFNMSHDFSNITDTQAVSLSGLMRNSSIANFSIVDLLGLEEDGPLIKSNNVHPDKISTMISTACKSYLNSSENKSQILSKSEDTVQRQVNIENQAHLLDVTLASETLEPALSPETGEMKLLTSDKESVIIPDGDGKVTKIDDDSLSSMTFYNSQHNFVNTKDQITSQSASNILEASMTSGKQSPRFDNENILGKGVGGEPHQAQKLKSGFASLSESEAWSEPDRNVSLARIGLQENTLKALAPNAASNIANSITCRSRQPRITEIDSTDSSEETAKESPSRTPGKKCKEAVELRKLQSRLQAVEEMNATLKAELDILHQLKPALVNPQPSSLSKDVSINTSTVQSKLDKSTSIENLDDEIPTAVDIPINLLEEIRNQREKLELSLAQNDFIRRQLEGAFASVVGSEGHSVTEILLKIKNLTDALQLSNSRNKELEEQLSVFKEKLAAIEKEKENLQKTSQQIQVAETEIETLRKEINDLEIKLKEKDNEILELKCAVLELENKAKEQAIEIEKTIHETDFLRSEADKQLKNAEELKTTCDAKIKKYEEKLHCAEEKMVQAELERDDVRSEMAVKVSKLEEEIIDAERRRNNAELQVIELKKQIQVVESQRGECLWKIQNFEETLKQREMELEQYYNDLISVKDKEIECANEQLRKTEKELEARDWVWKTEFERKMMEADRIKREVEVELRCGIESAKKEQNIMKEEAENKLKEVEHSHQVRETELKEKIQELEHQLWGKDADLRRQLDEATLATSQIAVERTRLVNEKLHLEQEMRKQDAKYNDLLREKREIEGQFHQLRESVEKQFLGSIDDERLRQATCNTAPTSFPGMFRGYNRQFSDISDYVSEDIATDDYDALFSRTWSAMPTQYNLNSDSYVHRNANSSPDLGIESDHGRFSSLEANLGTSPSTKFTSNQASDNFHLPEKIPTQSDSNPGKDFAKLEQENAELKKRLLQTRRALEKTVEQLTVANQRKMQVEKAISQQLLKTNHILKQSRVNFEMDGGFLSDQSGHK